MTDRVRTLVVYLEDDMRDDDVQEVVKALQMVRCVAEVKLGPINKDYLARDIAKLELRKELREFWMKLLEI